MKRIYYLLVCFLPLLLAGCEEVGPTDEEILNSREFIDLDVHYSYAGAPVSGLEFDHKPSRYVLDVDLNDDNLRWTLESDREWCKVAGEGNRGPGSIALEIASNEDFEAREEATLTFVAGEYRGFKLKVNQDATAFVVAQPFFVAPVRDTTYYCNITTLAGTDWQVEADSWISVKKGSSVGNGEFNATSLRIDVAGNAAGASRYGTVTLKSSKGDSTLNVFQLGNEYQYDSFGNLMLPGSASEISITVPRYMVAGVDVPEYAGYKITEGEGDTAVLTLSIEENYSDCSETREIEIDLRLANSSASLVDFPKIVQDYTPAHGLVTAKGLRAFADAVASGASTADWEQNGVVVVVGDINMYDAADWPGIGTATKPFTGSFDGGGHSVLNLRNSSHGLFNYCKGATIKDITLGKGGSLFTDISFGKTTAFGGVVSYAEGTTVSGCGMACDVEFGGGSEDDDSIVYLGGVVGYADAGSKIERAKMSGKITVSSPPMSDATCYLGGIAGVCEGSLSSSEVLGQVNFSSGLGIVYAGGVEGALSGAATASGNSFMGTVNLGGNADYAVLGGLYGRIDGERSFDNASDKSVMLGAINVNSYHSTTSAIVYAGGFSGLVAGGSALTFKGYEAQTNITLDFASSALQGRNICVGGVLGGCDPAAPVASLTFDGIVSSGISKTTYSTGVTCQVRRLWVGGIAGYVNGPASFTGCTNKGEVGKVDTGTYCARSNGYNQISGGIVAYAHGGDVSLSNCINQGNIADQLYNNNGVTGVWENMYTPLVAGGIVGAFNYGTTAEAYKLTISSCTNGKDVMAYRGYTGGIVGFCVNADISGCNNIGRLNCGTTDLSAYRGGIAGAAGNATISNCSATCDIYAKVYGSADYACAGGIVGIAREDGPVSVSGCSYFGTVKADKMSTTKPEYPGGVIGLATEGCTVSDCKFGGNIQGIDISENNAAANAVGNGLGTVSGISYWSGK